MHYDRQTFRLTHPAQSPEAVPFCVCRLQKVQSVSSRRLAFCERITSTRSLIHSSNSCDTMDTGDCPFRKKRRPWRMELSSFALVTVMLVLCQTTVARAGKTVSLIINNNSCDVLNESVYLHLFFFFILHCLTWIYPCVKSVRTASIIGHLRTWRFISP